MNASEILSRETDFHDRWAASAAGQRLDWAAHFLAATAPENRWILRRLGPVRGRTVLDLGCGLGENSVFFATCGAEVIAADLSPGMVEQAVAHCAAAGHTVQGRVINAQAIALPDASVDIVYAANLLHHVPDPEQALAEIHRVLRPGGCFCAWDPLRHNPLINIYRRLASGVRTPDERPVAISLPRQVGRRFRLVTYDTFWLASLWIFLRFYFVEGIDPNRERYWKKIITEHRRLTPLYRQIEPLDRLLKACGFGCMAWNLAFVARK